MPRILLLLLLLARAWVSGATDSPRSGVSGVPVTLTEDPAFFILGNSEVVATIEKRSGAVVSLKYRGLDLLGHGRGYWSFVGSASRLSSASGAAIRTDPKVNGGARAEIACIFKYDQKPQSLPADVELRYALGRGEHSLYAYAVWNHPATYPKFSIGEARYAVKLNPGLFDFMTIDARRNRQMPTGADWDQGTQLNMKEVRRLTTGLDAGQVEHKYDYSAGLAETPAYGWSSTTRGVGLWIVNPSLEAFAGGPTKVELTGHLDVNPGGAPTLLNMWLGSHYGGSSLAIAQEEAWSKVIGPFLLYANAAGDPQAMWKDALAQASKEQAAWPYAWVSDPLYPLAEDRGTVHGQLALRDPLVKMTQIRNLRVGLSMPDYQAGSERGGAVIVDWQRDGKGYQFWSRADAEGRFSIGQVRPGTYTLHAFADGVLGEFSKTKVTIAAGQKLDLGVLPWTPERHGRQLWEIGVPDRSAAEFRHGDDYWHWGLYLKYPEEFPEDVNYTIGKSDWRHDWNYCQPPVIGPDGRVQRETTWSIHFDLETVPRGTATLRLAFCGARAGCRVSVAVNGENVGDTGALPEDGVMHRDGIRGDWFERKITFESAHLHPGANVLQLASHATSWPQAVLYDYLRLEAEDAD